VPLPRETIETIRDLGPVRYLVACTQRHEWRLEQWHALFPDAQLWAPRRKSLPTRPRPTPLNDLFTDTPHHGWAADFEQLAFKGSLGLREVLFLHKKSRTLILGDLVEANPMMEGKPFRNSVFKIFGVAAPRGGVALDIRLSFVRRRLARQSLQRLLSWDFDRIVISHGACVTDGAKDYIRDAFRWVGK